jgi:hypothetical protein
MYLLTDSAWLYIQQLLFNYFYWVSNNTTVTQISILFGFWIKFVKSMAHGGGVKIGKFAFTCVYIAKLSKNLPLKNHYARKTKLYLKPFSRSTKLSSIKKKKHNLRDRMEP